MPQNSRRTEQNSDDDEGQAVHQISSDQHRSPAELINGQQASELRDEGKDAVDSLVLEGILGRDADLGEYGDREVLDRRDAGELDRGLDGAGEEQAAERGSGKTKKLLVRRITNFRTFFFRPGATRWAT